MVRALLSAGLAAAIAWANLAALRAVAAVPTFRTPGDVPLCLAATDAADPNRIALAAGYQSGQIRCLSVAADRDPEPIWSTTVDGAVLALLPVAAVDAGGRAGLVAATDRGMVVCLAPAPGSVQRRWEYRSPCHVSSLAPAADLDGDGVPEVIAAGADHRVHLLSGRSGAPLWARSAGGFVLAVAAAGDLNADGIPDLVGLTGELLAMSGQDGHTLWDTALGAGFADALARGPDLDGDGIGELITGGNDAIVRACSGRSGTLFWAVRLDRPVRDVLVSSSEDKGPAFVFAVTAGGLLACIPATLTEPKPRWTAALRDLCRQVVALGDLDGDGQNDVAACAENGVVAAFSGATGKPLWRWQGPDVIRTICALPAGRTGPAAYVAAACLDGSITVLLAGSSAAWKT